VAYLCLLFFVKPFAAAAMNSFVFVARIHLVWTAGLGLAVLFIDDPTVQWTGWAWYGGTVLWWVVGFRLGRFLMHMCKCGYEINGTLASTKLWPLLGR